MRKNCSSDREKLLKFEAEGREFAKFLRSLEQFIQTVHSGWKGIFDYFKFCFLVARSMHLNITRDMRSNEVEIVEFQGKKMNF